MSLGCQLKSKAFCISGLYQSLDAPKSPLRRGNLNAYCSPLVEAVPPYPVWTREIERIVTQTQEEGR